MILLKSVKVSFAFKVLRGVADQITLVTRSTTRSYFIGSARSMLAMDSLSKKADNQKLFVDDSQAKNYADFRPTYPSTVFETISKYCTANSTKSELAVDIGCGSGQSTLPLTKYFTHVIGVDVSQKQISNAPSDVPGLTFRVSVAEELTFVEDGSVDLITIGQALHWIQLDKFYSEVDRILRPGGSVVAYGYSTMSVDHPQVNDYLMHVYGERLSASWGKDREHVENKYSLLSSPYGKWMRNDELVMEKHYTAEQLVGYLNSWSAVQTYTKQNPHTDLIGEIRKKLSTISSQDGVSDGEDVYKLTWPVFMLMTHKPHS